jgi:asparagine synthase (glutamine-hydrolysing)
MLQPIAWRGPDGIFEWSQDSIAVAALVCNSTAAALEDGAPVFDTETNTLALFEGRLDDRSQLLRDLQLRKHEEDCISDVRLLLAAHKKWGDACFERFAGDFACIIWQAGPRRCLCARDRFASRPFFYALDACRFLFASEPRALLRHPAVVPDPNLGVVGEHLLFRFQSIEETLYRDIKRLPPGHLLVVEPQHIKLTCYWSPTRIRRVRYRRFDDYAEHFAELLRLAVVDRLRCDCPVAVALSGGLDSTAIVRLAEEHMSSRGIPDQLLAYSVVFPGLECDESIYIDEAVRDLQVASHRIVYEGIGTPNWAEQARHSADLPEYPTFAMNDPLLRAASAAGARVLLAGEGGDEWLSGTSTPYIALLRRLAIADIAKHLYRQGRQLGARQALDNFLKCLAWASIPSGMLKTVYRMRAVHLPAGALSEDYIARYHIKERVRPTPLPAEPLSLALRHILLLASGPMRVHFAEACERSDARRGMQRWSPFHDRRIADFVLGVPDDIHSDGATSRLLLRRSLRQLLPGVIAARKHKAVFLEPWIEALRSRTVQEVLDDPVTRQREWSYDRSLDCRSIAASYDAARNAAHLLPLCWMAFAIETWYRSVLENTEEFSCGRR